MKVEAPRTLASHCWASALALSRFQTQKKAAAQARLVTANIKLLNTTQRSGAFRMPLTR